MREHSRDRGRLEDILKYAQNVEKIMDGISYDDFTKDIRIYYSVMKNVEVIGEAANMLTRHFRKAHAELPWRQIVSMRNVLVHGYAQVSDIDQFQSRYIDLHRATARERYDLLMQRCPGIVDHLDLQDIASFLNITPKTISKIRHDITFDGRKK